MGHDHPHLPTTQSSGKKPRWLPLSQWVCRCSCLTLTPLPVLRTPSPLSVSRALLYLRSRSLLHHPFLPSYRIILISMQTISSFQHLEKILPDCTLPSCNQAMSLFSSTEWCPSSVPYLPFSISFDLCFSPLHSSKVPSAPLPLGTSTQPNPWSWVCPPLIRAHRCFQHSWTLLQLWSPLYRKCLW